MDHSDIYTAAAGLLIGDLTECQAQTLERCCAAAKTLCLSRLTGEVTEEFAPVFVQACALMAAGLYLDGEATEGTVSAFTAGRLSVTTGAASGSTRAQRLKRTALELLAPVSGGEGAFLGVRG